MSKTSSPPTPEPGRAPSLWTIVLYTLAASACMAAAVAVANASSLPPKLILDFTGGITQGQAEILQGRDYTLRYTGEGGAIYRCLYRDGFPWLGVKPGAIRLAVRPGEPTEFQPAGASYVPGLITFALVMCGLTFLTYVRRLIFRRHRAKTGVELHGLFGALGSRGERKR